MEIELLYNNILIENPFFKGKTKGSIHLDSNLEKKMQEEQILGEMEKTKRLKVYKAGTNCIKIKDGDEVFIETNRLMASPRVAIDDEKDYFILRENDVVFIYKAENKTN